MNGKTQTVYNRGNRNIYIQIVPGHFATNHSHINFYVDMTNLKTQYHCAKAAAGLLVSQLEMSMPVDTVICLEGTEMIGAFIAQELSQNAPITVNKGVQLSVISPELNVNNQMIFQHNTQRLVSGKCVLLLISSITTGKTIKRAIDCLNYYQGHLVGVGAIFSAQRDVNGIAVHSVFTEEDLPEYRTYTPSTCEMCQQKQKIDAIVNNVGYTPIE